MKAPPTHKPRRYKDDNRVSSAKRGYSGKRWNYLRRKTFLRDKYICQDCGRITVNPQCDHIVPKPEGKDILSNLQTLCHSCHSAKTMKEKMNKERK